MHDLIVRNGTLVDGTGAPARRADVAVHDGVIVGVGEARDLGSAREVVDADGCWVTPGFIDPHTHLDAQLCWDGTAAPSNLHGVTSVVIGLCGFGVAPAPTGGAEYLLRSLERVEEIPYDCTVLGVPFAWSTWSEYFTYVRSQPLGVNVAGFVPHSALRYYAMRDRARGEVATADDRAAMVRELREAIATGAIGFATSRGPNHVDGFGDPVPSRFADDDELRALVDACRGRTWQVNVETKFGHDATALNAEVARYAEWSRAAGARLTWSPFHAESADSMWPDVLSANHDLNASGVTVAPQVSALPIGVLLRFDEPSFVSHIGGWEPVIGHFFDLSTDDRLALLASTDVRHALRTSDPNARFAPRFDEWTVAASPSAPDAIGLSVAEAARRRGADPIDFLCDTVIADRLATLLQMMVANRNPIGAHALMVDEGTLLALGDAGAHVMSVTNYRYPTYMLRHLVLERQQLTLEHAVALITSKPARFYGLAGRGEIRAGAAADLCVIDPNALAIGAVQVAHDLPGGAPRLYQDARGYRAVFVNGVRTIADDTPTDARPGTALSAS
jgi:N-acyl-D-aspartate/D-glutamate deacylase